MGKFTSRKFITTWVSIAIFCVLPVVFSQLGVPNEVQLLALGCIGAATGTYNLANGMASKKGEGQ